MKRLSTFAIPLLAACGGESPDDGAVEGSGVAATEERTVAPFTRLRASLGVTVALAVDPAHEGDVVLRVTADDNLLDLVTTRVEGGTLVAEVSRDAISEMALAVEGTVASMVEVEASTGAAVEVMGIGADAFDYRCDDDAVCAFTGSADSASAFLDGAATVDASELATGTTNAHVRSESTLSVCATLLVSGSATGHSEVEVWCDPADVNVDADETSRVVVH